MNRPHDRQHDRLQPPDAQLGSDARERTLRALHRLGGTASYGALLTTSGLTNRALDDALKGLARDRWVQLDSHVLRALGGLWHLTPDRRRAAVLAQEGT